MILSQLPERMVAMVVALSTIAAARTPKKCSIRPDFTTPSAARKAAALGSSSCCAIFPISTVVGGWSRRGLPGVLIVLYSSPRKLEVCHACDPRLADVFCFLVFHRNFRLGLSPVLSLLPG